MRQYQKSTCQVIYGCVVEFIGREDTRSMTVEMMTKNACLREPLVGLGRCEGCAVRTYIPSLCQTRGDIRCAPRKCHRLRGPALARRRVTQERLQGWQRRAQCPASLHHLVAKQASGLSHPLAGRCCAQSNRLHHLAVSPRWLP